MANAASTAPSSSEAHTWAVYHAAMALFEDFEAPEGEVAAAITVVRVLLRGSAPQAGLEAAIAAFEHWAAAFERARGTKQYDAIKAWARDYLATDGPYSASPYNLAQGAMKAAIHLSWKRLYALRTGQGHADVRDAVLDAMAAPQQRAIEYYRRVYEELAAEKGETAEQMVRRVCGE